MRLCRALRLLELLVAQAPRSRRRELVEQIPPLARTALVRWMEAVRQGSVPPVALLASSGGKRPLREEQPKTSTAFQSKGWKEPSAVSGNDLPGGGCLVGKKAMLGVSRKMGGYQARSRIARYLGAVTQCYPSRERAVQCHEVLQRIKETIAADSATVGEADGDWLLRHLRDIIEEACADAGLRPSDLGLSFCALVDAHCIVGRTVAGSYSTDLEKVLEQRQRLMEARSKGWPSLRAEWVLAMQAPVQARSGTWGRARGQPKQLLEAERVADEAHLSYVSRSKELLAEREWRQLRRQLGRAAEAVVSVAVAEARRQQRRNRQLAMT